MRFEIIVLYTSDPKVTEGITPFGGYARASTQYHFAVIPGAAYGKKPTPILMVCTFVQLEDATAACGVP